MTSNPRQPRGLYRSRYIDMSNYALFVSTEQAEDQDPLPAHNDAKLMVNFLRYNPDAMRSLGLAEVKPSSVENIKQQMSWLVAHELKELNRRFFYYSGHGTSDEHHGHHKYSIFAWENDSSHKVDDAVEPLRNEKTVLFAMFDRQMNIDLPYEVHMGEVDLLEEPTIVFQSVAHVSKTPEELHNKRVILLTACEHDQVAEVDHPVIQEGISQQELPEQYSMLTWFFNEVMKNKKRIKARDLIYYIRVYLDNVNRDLDQRPQLKFSWQPVLTRMNASQTQIELSSHSNTQKGDKCKTSDKAERRYVLYK
ncbi:uncharacterized protein FOMMEDRAFT_30426 [Fomitiporia mediterranea MF3/22]|uniref:uncharacterized protein n=1 Tax=Fomitiporia mediterranea (strain MF3/22) TaxID=694068 RepID=UPI0004408DB6|nr:uncharacterized protein FOMMEDRAFT_30426 [Fomitiporia mediterranea MF3/22]EJD00354.1 hypothetical protein FOMMEDRAFT_30426 [Fomitiporia mediterranea MF3/22]